MDLVTAAVGLQQSKTLGQIQIAVVKKVLESQQADGAAALKLLQAASQGAVKAGDQMVAAATGLGGSIDVYG